MAGQFNETKNALKTKVEEVIPESTVTGNWRQAVKLTARHLPVISVRFANEIVWGPYDTPVTSEMEAGYRFSLFIFHSNCMVDTYDKAHYAYNVADRLKNGLFSNPAPIGWDVEMIGCKELEPMSARVSRVVIEGRINIQRVD